MDLTAIGGLIFGVIAVFGGFLLEGGHLGALVQPTAAVIVFGGTIGATVVGYSLKEVLTIPRYIKIAFTSKELDVNEYIELIVSLAEEARREGLLYLENKLRDIDDAFLYKGIQLVVDGTDPEVVKSILEAELYSLEERHKVGSSIFETAGGYAPTMGIIGTVMGLVHVLGSITEPDSLGPAIAVAFMATLYGIASANLIWLPLSEKLRGLSEKERLVRELMLDGIISLQAGYNPILIRERLTAFLSPSTREKADEDEEDEERAGEGA